MVFPKRRLKTTSTQCTQERKPTTSGGGNTINTNATTEVPAAADHAVAAARPLTEIPQLSQTTPAQFHNNEIESQDMPSCDDCGIVFENMHDLQRHVKKWCPEKVSLKRKRDDEEMEEDQPPQKWIPFEPEKKEENKESQEDDVFNHLMKMAKEDNKKLWDQKYDK